MIVACTSFTGYYLKDVTELLESFVHKMKMWGLCIRNSEKSQRSQLDLCVVVFRTRSPASPEVGRLVEHSKRQVRGFVGCHKMLERDLYILVCLAFNHWHTGTSLVVLLKTCTHLYYSLTEQRNHTSYLWTFSIWSLFLIFTAKQVMMIHCRKAKL